MIPSRLYFTKLAAGGNDFICLDNTTGIFNTLIDSEHITNFVKHLCRRGLGIGADGVIMACKRGSGTGVDIVARFFEPDGSEVKLCGNGTACFTYWAVDNKLVNSTEVNILTAAGVAQGIISPDNPNKVRVCVPNPKDLRLNILLNINGKEFIVHHLEAGVPHVICFKENLEQLNINSIGYNIRHHQSFQPQGVNANFVKILHTGHIAIRTYEFGVEAETLACGTGSTAAAIITATYHNWPKKYINGSEPVLVDVQGEETLRIWFDARKQNNICDACLETKIRPIYHGELSQLIITELKNKQNKTKQK